MTADNMAFGKVSGYRLEECGIPTSVCEIAAATCTINLMGWHRGMHNGSAPRNKKRHALSGRWVNIKLATYGNFPHQSRQWRGATSSVARYIHADNFDAVNTILGCFGLDVEQVIQWTTNGNGLDADDRITLSLREIVMALAPVITATDALLGDADPRTHARGRQAAMALV